MFSFSTTPPPIAPNSLWQKTVGLTTAITDLDHKELDQMLREFFHACLQENQLPLFERCLDLIDFRHLEDTLKKLSPGFKDTLSAATRKLQLCEALKVNSRARLVENTKREVQRIFRHLLHSICAIIDLLINAINIVEMGRPPQSWWETTYMLSVIAFLATPFYLYGYFKPFFVTTLKTSSVFSATLAAGLGGLYAYTKWLRPLPIFIPKEFGENRTEAARNRTLPKPLERFTEVNKIEDSLAANNSRLEKIVMLIAKSGTGKSSLVNLFAYRSVEHRCHQEIFNGRDIYVTNGALLKGPADHYGKTPFNLLLDRIGSSAITVIEVFHAIGDGSTGPAIGDQLKTILGSQIKYILGTSTPEEWSKFKEKHSSALLGRIVEIQLEENEKEVEQFTLSILREEACKVAPDTSIPESIFKEIYKLTTEAEFYEVQPKKSIFVLNELLAAVRVNLKSIPKLQQLYQELAERERAHQEALLAMRLQNGYGTSLNEPAEPTKSLQDFQKEMTETQNRIKTCEETIARYKKLRQMKEKFNQSLERLARKIDEFAPEKIRKQFLLTSYYVLPELDKTIEKIETEYQLRTPITSAMVTEMVKKLAKKKSD